MPSQPSPEWIAGRLEAIPLLASLSRPELEDLASLGEWRQHEAGDILVRKGEDAQAVYLVYGGRIVLHDEPVDQGRGYGGSEIGTGEYLGAQNLLTGLAHEHTAVVPVHSEIFALPKRSFYQFVAQHPRVGDALISGRAADDGVDAAITDAEQPADSSPTPGDASVHQDTVSRLQGIPLFSSLSEEALLQVASLMHWERQPAGTAICEQGEPGGTFYLIARGLVSVKQADTRGIQRTLNQLGPGDFFGETSLLTGEPRDATITALEDVELFALEKSDFDRLMDQYTQIRRELNIRADVREKLGARRFAGRETGEFPVAFERKHAFVLIKSLSLPALVALVVGSILGGMVYLNVMVNLVGWVFLAGIIPWLTWVAWLAYDWYNDDYIVTDRRVIHIERVLFFFEERHEAPLEKIQNINKITAGPIARWLDFHDLVIQTAGREGSIVFKSIPRAQMVCDLINQQKSRIGAPDRAKERERMRQDLREEFGWAEQAPSGETPDESSGQDEVTAGPVTRALASVADYFLPRLRFEEGGTITWRKHWFVLITASWKPGLVVLALLGLLAVLAVKPLPLEQDVLLWVIVGYLLVLAVALARLWWQYEDWRNDIYILSASDIKDIDRQPLWLHEEMRQASLGQVQDVRYEIPSPVAVLLGYGNVLIETAGKSGMLTFLHVAKPQEIQEEIFRRIQHFERAKKRREWADRRAEMIHALGSYHEVLQEQNMTVEQG